MPSTDLSAIRRLQGLMDILHLAGGAMDWSITSGARYVPNLPSRDDPGAWHPGDEFFVPCRDSDGNVLAVLSLAEPLSGRRPTDDDIDFVVSVANHAARALEHAQRTQEAARHRTVLEHLLAVSSMFAGEQRSIDAILQSVCEGVQRALGFQRVTIELIDADSGLLVPRAAAG